MLTLFFFSKTNNRHISKSAHIQQNKGFGSVEFLLVATPLLLLGMGSLEASYWYITRQAGSLALLEAARAAATNHASPHSLEQAFEKALRPLFVPAGKYPDPAARMQAYFNRVSQKTGQAPWRIIIQSPSQADFIDFQQKDLPISQQTGLPAINSNYQYEQYLRAATGQFSGNTIFQANTLQIELTYPYQTLIPGLGQLVKMLSGKAPTYHNQLTSQGFLPIKQSLSISMQSHPVLWPTEPTAKVLYSHSLSGGRNRASQHTGSEQTCIGLWCGQKTTTSAPDLQNTLPGSQQGGAGKETGGQAPSTQNEAVPENEILIDEQDPACGISLCCT